MKLVSVIIPIYNGEKYLEDCLRSLCNQTYKELEIILIDDGSKDNSRKIIEKYLYKDSRIKAFFNENHGVSFSRNFGIKNCCGEYISFVDADDIIAPDFIEILLKNIIKYNADMSAVGIIKRNKFSEFLFDEGETNILKGKEILEQLFGVYEGFLWNKLYKKSLLQKNNISLEQNIRVCEDLLFNVKYLKYSSKVVYDSGKKYFYRQDANSTINRLDNINWFDCIKVYREILSILKEYPLVEKKVLENYTLILCEAMYRIRFIFEEKEELNNEIRFEWEKVKNILKNISLKKKVKICIFRFFPSMVMKYRRRKL